MDGVLARGSIVKVITVIESFHNLVIMRHGPEQGAPETVSMDPELRKRGTRADQRE
jgi:hypothetical protein